MPRGGRAKPPNTPTGGPMKRTLLFTALVPLLALAGARSSGPEDESVFVTGLRAGQHESLLYVWTSDADAKDPDFLSVVDADPKSPSYAKVIATAPTGSTVDNEAHHFGYTVNTDRIFAGGLVSNRLFIYDVKTDPRHPKLIKTIPDLGALTGYSGPHTYYAVPGGVMIAMLGAKDGGGPGALVKLDNDGKFLEALPAPNRPDDPGYMYDVGVKPELNRMITSSWTHPHHFRGNPVEVVRMRPARGDHPVQLGLHPHVIHVARVVGAVRGRQGLEELAVVVELDEGAGPAPVLGAEHRDHHAARNGVVGVRARVAGERAQIGDGPDELGMSRVRLHVVDEQPVRDQAAREDPVGVHRVAEVMRLVVHGGAGGRGGDDLGVARRLGIGVDDAEKVRVLGIGVARPDVEQGLVLAGPQAGHDDRFVLGARGARSRPGEERDECGEEQRSLHWSSCRCIRRLRAPAARHPIRRRVHPPCGIGDLRRSRTRP